MTLIDDTGSAPVDDAVIVVRNDLGVGSDSEVPRTLNSMGDREWHQHETRPREGRSKPLGSHAILFSGTLLA